MKTVTATELQQKMKHVLEDADKNQEVLIMPSTKNRGDIFIVPGKVYNKMSDPGGKYTQMTQDRLAGHLKRIMDEDASLLDRLAE